MPNTTPKTLQLPPADLQAQERAWKDYVRHKFHPKPKTRGLMLAIVCDHGTDIGTRIMEV